MTGKVRISLLCPPMKVNHLHGRLYQTAKEPMVATIDFDDGTGFYIRDVIIPPTDVHEHLLAFPHVADVDACKGSGAVQGCSIVVNLPIEPVMFDKWHLVAKAITATVIIALADGSIAEGSVVFPDCKVPLLGGVAESVTAVGEAVFQ